MDDVSQIAVTSIGCGNMVDYWGLLHALEEKGGQTAEYDTLVSIK